MVLTVLRSGRDIPGLLERIMNMWVEKRQKEGTKEKQR
jgi:hypothetical protein